MVDPTNIINYVHHMEKNAQIMKIISHVHRVGELIFGFFLSLLFSFFSHAQWKYWISFCITELRTDSIETHRYSYKSYFWSWDKLCSIIKMTTNLSYSCIMTFIISRFRFSSQELESNSQPTEPGHGLLWPMRH